MESSKDKKEGGKLMMPTSGTNISSREKVQRARVDGRVLDHAPVNL